MDRACTGRWLRRRALLAATALAIGLTGSLGPPSSAQPTVQDVVEAFDTAVTGFAATMNPAPSRVLGTGQVGPYEPTVAGLVDIDSRIPGGTASGTGIVLRSDGVVVTNNHVVARATTITATDIADGHGYQVTVLGRDPGHDVAVIQMVGASGLPVAPLGDSDQVRVGDVVAAIGNAGGRGGRPTITTGAVTALDQSIVAGDESSHQRRRLRGMIQVSASVQPGDSGGALLGSGGVIGMNTAAGPGTGFAIPINTVTSIARRLSGSAPSEPDLSALSTQQSLSASSQPVGVMSGGPRGSPGD